MFDHKISKRWFRIFPLLGLEFGNKDHEILFNKLTYFGILAGKIDMIVVHNVRKNIFKEKV